MALTLKASPPYVILENDVVYDLSLDELQTILNDAPSNWEVLQLHVLNKDARRQFCKLEEKYVRWLPEYYSTAVTVVKNEVVASNIHKLHLEGHCVLDYWLYSNNIAYTHTGNTFQTLDATGQINTLVSNSLHNMHHRCQKTKLYERTYLTVNIAFVVVTTDASKFNSHYRLTAFPPFVSAHVISRIDDLDIPRLYNYHWITKGRFSKWVYFERFVNAHIYDYFMFADDDISFVGFPWFTLVKNLTSMQIELYGVPRESEFANSVTSSHAYQKNTVRDFFIHSNGDFWRNIENGMSNRWSHFIKSAINSSNLNFVEQGVVVFSQKFVRWFFRQIRDLLRRMMHIPSDWVIDTIWCPALKVYNSTKRCQMFEHPAWHIDAGSLTNHYSSDKLNKNPVVKDGMRLTRWASRQKHFETWIQDGRKEMAKFARGYFEV